MRSLTLKNGPRRSAERVTAITLCLVLAGAMGLARAATLTFNSRSRPVMRAVLELSSECACVITYEEPRYVYQGDLEDVTHLRRDLSRFAPGKAPRVFRPVGGSVQLTIPSGAKLDPQTTYGVLNTLAQSWRDSNQGGAHFEVEQENGVFHVIPTEVRDRNGNWATVQSILGMPISLAREPRTELELFKAICSAISGIAGLKVISAVNGGFILGPLDTTQYVLGAQGEPANSVLMRAIKIVGQNLTWVLTYEPTMHVYFLNIDDLRTMPSPMIWPPS